MSDKTVSDNKKSDDANPKNEPTFEDRMEVLEELVTELETGSLPLDQQFEKYQKGIELLRSCNRTLEQMEQRIEVLEKEGRAARALELDEDEDAREG